MTQYFQANWTYTPVDYANTFFDPQNVDEWVRFVDNSSSSRLSALGDNPLYRYRGMVTVQVFVKPSVGEGRVLALCDNVTTLFRDKRISGIQFGVPQPNKIGTRDGWYQVNVICPYYRDEE